jgi:hypothetical protein
MCDTSGQEITYTAGVPKDAQAMRTKLIAALQQGMSNGATPYSGPVAAGTNQLSLQGANIMSNLMGGIGYNQANPVNALPMTRTSGGGGTGSGNGITGFNNTNKYSGVPGRSVDPRAPVAPPYDPGNPTPGFTNPSAPPGTCFVAGTEILMADGSVKPIDEIKCGDMVRSYDVARQKFYLAEVTEVLVHLPEEVDTILCINGHLRVTPEHPVWINGEWDKIGHAVLMDELMGSDGQTVKVVSIAKEAGGVPVYHFHTNHKTHNYFAGGILAHNNIPKQQDPYQTIQNWLMMQNSGNQR